ncbi:uncharacterized protein [Physcomitrium patens]|uniref:uncharacterized protein isoform X2 n=1 Tax=Physcomitrium patens TaxID=3218 RepID=UPI003CCE45AA
MLFQVTVPLDSRGSSPPRCLDRASTINKRCSMNENCARPKASPRVSAGVHLVSLLAPHSYPCSSSRAIARSIASGISRRLSLSFTPSLGPCRPPPPLLSRHHLLPEPSIGSIFFSTVQIRGDRDGYSQSEGLWSLIAFGLQCFV